jgi:alanine dehydrogenase
MKFAVIKERKNPPDRRVVLTPSICEKVITQYPQLDLSIESSDIRFFKDEEYISKGFTISEDISDCDVMLGVKEVPVQSLLPNKKYFFFSHTIKKAPYNRKLLQAVLEKKIELYDHETITKSSGARLIGFGRYAGIVGAYNGLIAYGLKNKLWTMPKAENLQGLDEMKQELSKIKLPNFKICLTGNGKVANGAKEILDYLKIKEVSVNAYLNDAFQEPVYCKIDVLDYNKRKDGEVLGKTDFYNNASEYVSDFMRFAKVSNFFIAGHFYDNSAPFLYTREDCRSEDFNIQVVADVSCDIDGPVASTIKPSTIADPIYGYNPETESVIDFMNDRAIVVMAVDNLPCELPKDASEGFGEMFLEHVIPAFFNKDKDGILERAKMTTSDGKLTPRYAYLQDYVDGVE